MWAFSAIIIFKSDLTFLILKLKFNQLIVAESLDFFHHAVDYFGEAFVPISKVLI